MSTDEQKITDLSGQVVSVRDVWESIYNQLMETPEEKFWEVIAPCVNSRNSTKRAELAAQRFFRGIVEQVVSKRKIDSICKECFAGRMACIGGGVDFSSYECSNCGNRKNKKHP
jgi:hypothetical protein